MEMENKKTRRVGSITLAMSFILFGIVMILQMFLKFDSLRYILMLWPVIFIMLGIEILIFNSSQNLKFDGWSIFLVFVFIFASCILGIINFGVNEVLYNEDIKQAVAQYINY